MSYNESRDRKATAQVDYFGRWPDIGLHLTAASNGDDLSPPRSQRLGLGTTRFQRDQLGVAEHQVGRLSRHSARDNREAQAPPAQVLYLEYHKWSDSPHYGVDAKCESNLVRNEIPWSWVYVTNDDVQNMPSMRPQ
jgi:hypothetical protein